MKDDKRENKTFYLNVLIIFDFCSAFFWEAAFLGGLSSKQPVFRGSRRLARWRDGDVGRGVAGHGPAPPSPLPSAKAAEALKDSTRQERRCGGGALPDNGILEKHLTQLCVALFNAAHSLFSLNRCLETGSCLFF